MWFGRVFQRPRGSWVHSPIEFGTIALSFSKVPLGFSLGAEDVGDSRWTPSALFPALFAQHTLYLLLASPLGWHPIVQA